MTLEVAEKEGVAFPNGINVMDGVFAQMEVMKWTAQVSLWWKRCSEIKSKFHVPDKILLKSLPIYKMSDNDTIQSGQEIQSSSIYDQ